MRKYTVRSRKLSQSYLEAVFITLFIGLTLRMFVIAPYKIPNNSMAPALLAGDYVFVFKLPYGVRVPFFRKVGSVQQANMGDVVLFTAPQDPDVRFLKRIQGMAQHEVILKNDNKEASDDSRYSDVVPMENIEGKAVLIWFSFDSEARKVRWSRIFRTHL
jgi:signal peptidase I